VIWLIIVSISIYCVFLAWIYLGWKKLIPIQPGNREEQFVSVIIPVRNEAGNIDQLLLDLENQSYPKEKYEVLIINDHSTDTTKELVIHRMKQSVMQMELVNLGARESNSISSKKIAITRGVDIAKGDIILLTDGDSRLKNNWLETFVTYFKNFGFKLMAGPVFIQTNRSFFSKIQSVEFASLIGTGAALFSWGMPAMCNAANLAFTREVFLEVDGYKGNEHVISGDDEFLLKKIKRKYPEKVGFLKSSQVMVYTPAVNSVKDFIDQRIRWAGKWKNHSYGINTILALFIFYTHCCILTGLVLTLFGRIPVLIFTGLIFIKTGMEYLFINDIFTFGKKKMPLKSFLVCSILYSLYAIFFGIMANMGSYTWKGRYYKR